MIKIQSIQASEDNKTKIIIEIFFKIPKNYFMLHDNLLIIFRDIIIRVSSQVMQGIKQKTN